MIVKVLTAKCAYYYTTSLDNFKARVFVDSSTCTFQLQPLFFCQAPSLGLFNAQLFPERYCGDRDPRRGYA